MPKFLHSQLTALFKKYATIGGMPEVLKHYASGTDISSIGSVYKSLIHSFSDDVEKYTASSVQAKYIRHIIEHAFAEHITGQELLASKFSIRNKLNFWARTRKESDAEVDYVLPWQGKLIPIEVKSGGIGKVNPSIPSSRDTSSRTEFGTGSKSGEEIRASDVLCAIKISFLAMPMIVGLFLFSHLIREPSESCFLEGVGLPVFSLVTYSSENLPMNMSSRLRRLSSIGSMAAVCGMSS